MTAQIAVLMVTAVIGFRVPAFAQQGAPAQEKLKYRKWDVGGSLGLLTATRSDLGGVGPSNSNCDAVTWAGNIDVGRSFTQHLKAEAGISCTDRRCFYNSNSTYPPTFSFTSTVREVDPTSVSAAFTDQFFENVFAHSYVSAGIRKTSFYEETRTSVCFPNFSVAPIVTTSSSKFSEARPFVGTGYKSYFNERLYMRPKILVAFDENGTSHQTVRLGFGIDF